MAIRAVIRVSGNQGDTFTKSRETWQSRPQIDIIAFHHQGLTLANQPQIATQQLFSTDAHPPPFPTASLNTAQLKNFDCGS